MWKEIQGKLLEFSNKYYQTDLPVVSFLESELVFQEMFCCCNGILSPKDPWV